MTGKIIALSKTTPHFIAFNLFFLNHVLGTKQAKILRVHHYNFFLLIKGEKHFC